MDDGQELGASGDCSVPAWVVPGQSNKSSFFFLVRNGCHKCGLAKTPISSMINTINSCAHVCVCACVRACV